MYANVAVNKLLQNVQQNCHPNFYSLQNIQSTSLMHVKTSVVFCPVFAKTMSVAYPPIMASRPSALQVLPGRVDTSCKEIYRLTPPKVGRKGFGRNRLHGFQGRAVKLLGVLILFQINDPLRILQSKREAIFAPFSSNLKTIPMDRTYFSLHRHRSPINGGVWSVGLLKIN